MTTADILGRFLWHDLMTTDQGAAGEFYGKVTGWTTQPFDAESDYSLWVTPSGPRGGASVLSEDAQSAGTPPHWLVHIGTPDIESTVEDAKRLGGRVITEISDIPEVGKYAVLADPQGAVFGVYQPSAADGETPTGIGDFSWHELATTDQEAAWSFYNELFGWSEEGSHDMGPMGTYQLFGQSGKQLGGIYTLSSDTSTSPHWLCYVNVASASEAAEAAKAAGGQVVNGPMEVPGGDWVAQVIDPQGAVFAVHESKAQAAKSAQKPSKKASRKSAAKADSASGSEAVASRAAEEAEAPAAARASKSKRKSAGGASRAGGAASKTKGKAAAKSKAPAAAKKGASKQAAPQKKAAAKKKSAAVKKKPAAPKKAALKKKGSAKAKTRGQTRAVAKSAAGKKKGVAAKKRR
jgi:predicted enzyme related to lactoylglutathione lyase